MSVFASDFGKTIEYDDLKTDEEKATYIAAKHLYSIMTYYVENETIKEIEKNWAMCIK